MPAVVRTLSITANDWFSDTSEEVTIQLDLLEDGTVRWRKTNLGGW